VDRLTAMRGQAGDDEVGSLQEVAAWLGVSLSAVKTLRTGTTGRPSRRGDGPGDRRSLLDARAAAVSAVGG